METFINSPAQLATRQRFKMAMHLLSPIATFLNSYYRPARRFSSGYTAAFSELVKFGIKGEYPVLSFDFRRIRLSRGCLPSPDCKSVLRKAGLLEVTWSDARWMSGRSDDEVVILIYSEDKNLFSVNRNLAERNHGKLACMLPDSFEMDKLHFYMLFVSRDGRSASDSAYLEPRSQRLLHTNKHLNSL